MRGMRTSPGFLLALLAGWLSTPPLRADERRFTYVYEPETQPAGALEFENWVTLDAGRSAETGQQNYNLWELRQELEYGVSDRYTLGLYLNESAESYRDSATGADVSGFSFDGLSLENRFNLLNPAEHAVGVTLYLEGTYSGEAAEIEEKIILGQRHGKWKWAFNLQHATEWEDQPGQLEGELGASLGLALDLSPHWSIGLELRSQTLLPDYAEVESTALFLGPVVSVRQDRWWAALSVLLQIHGWNFNGNPDGNPHLDLAENERLNVRLLLGLNF
jgi:hypothetical protein